MKRPVLVGIIILTIIVLILRSKKPQTQNSPSTNRVIFPSIPNPVPEQTQKENSRYVFLDVTPGVDNTSAILYYMNKAKAESKPLFIRKYTNPYILSDEVPVTCSIVSDGAEIRQTGYDKCVFTLTNQDGLSIEGLKIDANARTQSENLVYGKHVAIKVVGCKNLFISDLHLKKYWGAGISLNNCFDCIIDNIFCIDSVSTVELWPTSTEHGDTDLKIDSETFGARNTISNCKCYSHKSSIGIWVNGLGNETYARLENNFCAGLLPTLEAAGTDVLKKRHGIQLGYNESTKITFNQAIKNVCWNTGTTGISCASVGNTQKVDISHNYCKDNGLLSIDGEVLRAGINFQGYGFGCTCSYNTIVDFQTTQTDSGALSVLRGADSTDEGSILFEGNYIEGSKTNGIYIAYRAHNCKFVNTQIKNSTRCDIYYFDTTPDAHDIEFYGLNIERNNANFQAIRIQNAHDTKGLIIQGGRIKGLSNTYNDDNIGIMLLKAQDGAFTPIIISDIIIDTFGMGIGIYNPITQNVSSNVIVRHCHFRNLTYGFTARQGDANGIARALDCSFFNVTNLKGGWGYAVAAQIGNANYNYS